MRINTTAIYRPRIGLCGYLRLFEPLYYISGDLSLLTDIRRYVLFIWLFIQSLERNTKLSNPKP